MPSKFLKRSKLFVICELAPVSITQRGYGEILVVVQEEDNVLTSLGVSSFPVLAELSVLFSLFFKLAALSFEHSFQVWLSL